MLLEWHFEKIRLQRWCRPCKIICPMTPLINGKRGQRLEKINNIICNNRPDVGICLFLMATRYFFYDWRLKDLGLMYVFNADLNESWTIKFMGANQILDSINVECGFHFTMNINGHAFESFAMRLIPKMSITFEYNLPPTILEKLVI